MQRQITVLVRSFLSADKAQDSQLLAQYNEQRGQQLRAFLQHNRVLSQLRVIVHADPAQAIAEQYDAQGVYPTRAMVAQQLGDEYAGTDIAVQLVHDGWGPNPGSAQALNQGLAQVHTEYVMCWSPELAITGEQLNRAQQLMHESDLAVLGFLRTGWQASLPWRIPQNTGAIWRTETLKALAGFDPACDGGDGERLHLPGEKHGLLTAGMEDFHALLRLYQQPHAHRWGMLGVDQPIPWSLDLDDKRLTDKVLRQQLVMEAWNRQLNPDQSLAKTMECLADHAEFLEFVKGAA